MKRETGVWFAVALLSISAFAVSATTIESTMRTDANDVLDLDYDRIPIGQDTASTVLDEIEGSKRNGDPGASTDPDAQNPSESVTTQPDDSTSQQRGERAGDEEHQAQRNQQQHSQDDAAGTGPAPPSLLDRLLALLTALLPYLLVLAAVVAAVGLVARYRDRVLGLFEGPGPNDPDESTASESAGWLAGSPAHAVERAWLGMVRQLDLDRPGTMTTSECARAAIESGLDREAVRTLTETYEEVRYGEQPVTDQREQAARQSLRRIDVGGES